MQITQKQIKRMAELTMEILRARDDYYELRYVIKGEPYNLAWKNSRNQAIFKVLEGRWIERPFNKDLYKSVKKRISDELNNRPRRYECRTHPKKTDGPKPNSSIETVGCPVTRKKLEEEKECASTQCEIFMIDSWGKGPESNSRPRKRKRKTCKSDQNLSLDLSLPSWYP